MICNNLGELYKDLKKYDSSYYYLQKSIHIYDNLNENLSLAGSYFSLAQLFQAKGDIDNAIRYFKKVPTLLNNKLVLIVEEAYVELSNIYISKNNYKKGYEYLFEAKNISDSIGELSKDEKLTYADMQINFRAKVEEYEEGIDKTELEHKRIIRVEKKSKLFIVFFAGILAIAIILLYMKFRKSHNLNEVLVRRNTEIENQKSLIEISNIELNEKHAFTETLLNTIPNPVFYTSKRGVIIGCNVAFEETIGKKEEDLIGVNIKDIYRHAQFKCDLIDEFSAHETKEVTEGSMINVKGDKRDVICYKQEIVEYDKTVIGILGIIVDVTKIREAEKSLSLSKQKLKEANNAKDKFFSIMAHDLKNPFNAVLGLTHLISNKMDNFSAEEIKNYASLINKSAHQIYNLLENILEWARAQSGAIVMNRVVFDITNPITECLELLDNSIRQKSINIEFNNFKEINVCCDKNMILTVFRNILMNAIKYTPTNGLIKIDLQARDGDVLIQIIDNGIGISEENMAKLFKIDKPISTPGLQNEKGTGLGLIICKEFVSQNNGLLTVESEINKGSTFSITLPGSN